MHRELGTLSWGNRLIQAAVQGSSAQVLFVLQGPEEVFEATAQALLAGVDRDSLAGWGAIVYVITPEGVTAKTLKGRMD